MDEIAVRSSFRSGETVYLSREIIQKCAFFSRYINNSPLVAGGASEVI